MAENIPELEHRSRLGRFWHLLGIAVALVVIGLAGKLLYEIFKDVSPAGILASMRQIPPWKILLAVALTALNYAILVGYDWAGTRYVQHPLKLRRIALASFVCYALSHNLGWFLGGPASRYRLYSTAGLTKVEIVKLVSILWVAYWTGFFALAGLVFVIWPANLPRQLTVENTHLDLPAISARPLGIAFVVGVVLYLAATAIWKKPIKVRGQDVRLPPFRISLFLVTTAMLDIAVASSVLYVLLPPFMNVGLPLATSAYLLAMVVVITVHAPGGIGVFDIVIIAILAPVEMTKEQSETLGAALLVYRAIYYLMPLVGALVALLGHEIWVRRSKLKS